MSEKFDDNVLKQICGSDRDSEEIVKTFFKNDLEIDLDYILKDTYQGRKDQQEDQEEDLPHQG